MRHSIFLYLCALALGVQDACDVLCRGPIQGVVSSVQPQIFNDSKTFVDLVLMADPSDILDAFPKSGGQTNRTALIDFINKYFAPGTGTDVLPWNPPDYNDTIPLFNKITDPAMRDWSKQVHNVWNLLGRMQHPDVADNPQRHTLLPLKHPYMIVPGGRFIEFYYWDTYWILKGLLVSQMNQTAIMVVENLLQLSSQFGYVPNGSRRYMITRSQPPYLALMVDLLWQASIVNASFVSQALPIISAEHDYWMVQGKHAVTIARADKNYTLSRFYSEMTVPRPESAREDMSTASQLPASQQNAFYSAVHAGAETGWDFTSRWLADGTNLSSIDTLNVVPAELNALLYRVETTMARLYAAVAMDPPKNYTDIAAKRAEAIYKVLWDADNVQWRDFNLTANQQMASLSPANFMPVWSGVLDPQVYGVTIADVAQSFAAASGLLGPGGVCASLEPTGEQWDYPNVWPPLHCTLAEGFWQEAGPIREGQKMSMAHAVSLNLATSLIQAAYIGFNETGGYLLEKYNCSVLGALGGGGEYVLQKGFGWTNGAVLTLLNQFPDTPVPPPTALGHKQTAVTNPYLAKFPLDRV